jgi:prepilin-type N-terminal cleavage/methylation domain-containing protein
MKLHPYNFFASGAPIFKSAHQARDVVRGGLETGVPIPTRSNILRLRAFTLIEMLVVLIIIVLLTALALPHIRGSTESVAIKAATQQVVHDLAFARQKAISQRSIVAMVFLSGDALTMPYTGFDPEEQVEVKRLQGAAYTHYAIFSFRRVGEQPGQPTAGYLTEWKALPDKTFFGTNQFDAGLMNLRKFPYPYSRSPLREFPYIAFDHEGRCVWFDTSTSSLTAKQSPDIQLEIARGAVFFARDAAGAVDQTSLQIQEIPPGNSTTNVFINGLTGRAETFLPELK